ncbi:sulfur carrier protein ThiS [Glutamicibacter sp. PS]|uniref:sulfur carrier protein ThiS n=1 Tax=Glutamicibacter TaxID=1742989 RepID=UPI0028436D40|nr:sulfur carrier protein ThiS [Glutamicibacter sp. PS]MDR4532304.1 sulfur carrier protein ThiS [Glutamicibacter sp. PS]
MHSIDIQLNNQAHSVPAGSTARDLIATHTSRALGEDGRAVDGSRLGVALAVNGAVLPRGKWASYALCAGDRLDIVTAAQGG